MTHTTGIKNRGISRLWIVGAFMLLLVGVIIVSSMGSARITYANPNDPRAVALGQQVYAARCANCHGANLEGQQNWQQSLPTGGRPAPPHNASGHTWHHTDQLLFTIIKYGGQASSPAGYVNNMPAFDATLSDEEIYAVLAYIKSTWSPEILSAQQKIR